MTKNQFFWQPHPNPKLQLPWYLTQLGLLIFPLIPALGAISFIIASVGTWRLQYRTINNRPLNWGFAVLSVLLIATTGLADDKLAAFLGLFNFLPFFLLFAALSALIQTITQLRQLSWILVIGSIPVVFIGVGHMFWGWSLSPFWEIIFGWKLPQGINPTTRMASVMMNSNILAAYLLTVFIVGLGLWIENWQQINTIKKQVNNTNTKFRISSFCNPFVFLTLTLIGDFVALILTHSRNGWGSVIFACIAYAFYQSWYWMIAGITAVVVSVMAAARAPLPIAELFRKVIPQFFWIRLHNEVYSNAPLPIHRKSLWEFAWSLMVQRPWSGWGLRNFSLLYQAQTQYWLGHPHNLFLMLSAETGLPTTIFFFGLLTWLFIMGIRLLQNAKSLPNQDKLIFFSYLLAFVVWMIFNTVDVTIFDFRLNTLLWLTLAAICGVIYNYSHNLKSNKVDNF
ncbi:O-antigen ligase family protein [Plectonema cf. radiosum LEGE 06105]|uniref:O-antigen ligase family protein n=1 Tax=Plectonema cf. radiosum LEGE 06105 TaxID=945769 RepID=A0A8J7EYP1_9CYAN|nr:O-antigen ligase family protein [Plectonema radiosum]MBE9212233.1 O-antigen ligase family protein [Plectonema cf. radiosum LEGE 06105]